VCLRGTVFVRAHRAPQPSVPPDGLLVYGYLNYSTPVLIGERRVVLAQ